MNTNPHCPTDAAHADPVGASGSEGDIVVPPVRPVIPHCEDIREFPLPELCSDPVRVGLGVMTG